MVCSPFLYSVSYLPTDSYTSLSAAIIGDPCSRIVYIAFVVRIYSYKTAILSFAAGKIKTYCVRIAAAVTACTDCYYLIITRLRNLQSTVSLVTFDSSGLGSAVISACRIKILEFPLGI